MADQAKSTRFIGFQKTPIHAAFFGRSTKSGRAHLEQKMKHSTGPVQNVKKNWHLLDAAEVPLGRLATVAATLLMGKHKTVFTPGADSGDHVVVINAKKAFFTSNKADKKFYYWHTGYPGGLKMETAKQALQKHPEKVIWDSVYGMLPKNRLSRKQLSRLKIFNTAEHGMKAQNPQPVDLKLPLKNIPTEAQAS